MSSLPLVRRFGRGQGTPEIRRGLAAGDAGLATADFVPFVLDLAGTNLPLPLSPRSARWSKKVWRLLTGPQQAGFRRQVVAGGQPASGVLVDAAAGGDQSKAQMVAVHVEHVARVELVN
jgi:hypothetical protein